MRCTIVSKGENEYTTYLDDEKSLVTIFHNKEQIAKLKLDCYSAVYDGEKLLYTKNNNGSIFILYIQSEETREIITEYRNIIIWHVVRGVDNLILVLADKDYVIYDYVKNHTAFDTNGLRLARFYGISMNKYGEGLAAGYNKTHYDDEEWRYQAESFKTNLADNTLESVLSTKYSLYENFYETVICYDSSRGEASLPVFYVFRDAYYSKNVSENYIVYCPGYEHRVVIVADIFGKIHRLLVYPEKISNSSFFAYNEETDIVTIATLNGEIHRYYVNNVDTTLFEEMYRIYDQRNYFSTTIHCEIGEMMKKALAQAVTDETNA